MTIVVIDTNVFISALLKADSTPRHILRLCLQQKVTPIMGAALFHEYEEVMSRQHLFASCVLSGNERQELLADFVSVCQWVSVYYLWRPNLPDESDNHLVELAMAGNASHIITGNTKDLVGGELLFPSLSIQTPRQFLNYFEENQHGNAYH